MGRLCWVKLGIIDFSSLYLRRYVRLQERRRRRSAHPGFSAICSRPLLLNRFVRRVIAVIKLASKARGYLHT